MPGGGNAPDTPGDSTPSTPHRPGEGPRERNVFHLDNDDSADDASPHSAQGYDRPDQTVFDLTMDYSDDETLLDWEQYAGMRKFRCWGLDCSLVARFCPFLPWVPPEWYYRYSRRQRRMMKIGAAVFGGLLLVLVGATVLLSLLPNQATPSGLGFADEECNWASYKLPQAVRPVQYDLALAVELQDPFLVAGGVVIHANITKPSKCIVLHALGINITSAARLNPAANGTWQFNNKEQLIVRFKDAIQPPAATLELHFNYTLSQGLSGFYRSNYTDANGGTHIMGTTQMEANSARKAFPCFDEPAYKARWNVSITAPRGQTVLANMPEESSETVAGGVTRHQFVTTPPMSSYLVAFIVGNLTSVSATVPHPEGSGSDRPVKIWGTPDRAEDLQTALQIATTVLPAYESLFGVPYALPKLDLVAVPDFAAGAMENWGLITYRETDLLYNTNHSSVSNERRVAVVIAHEMAHLWFGDLVTMGSWGELWLNEGFATYFENVGAAIARPNFAYAATFFSDIDTDAMSADALPASTHPLADLSGMDTAEQIEAMFDDISYQKGGSVLRMLRAYLGRNGPGTIPWLRRSLLQSPEQPEAFMRGLQAYLKRFAYNNTSSNDLWAEMDAATGEGVSSWMHQWTFQSGIPRVQVLLDGALDRDVKIYQSPFEVSGSRRCDDGPKGMKSNSAPWWIPLASVTRSKRQTEWTTFDTCFVDRPIYTLQDDEDWIKLNAGQYGLFRVNYPVSIWDKLAAAAGTPAAAGEAPAVPAEDLAGLLDDSWALSDAGETDIVHFLELARAMAKRQGAELAPWSVAAGNMVSIYHGLKQSQQQADCAERWAAFVRANLTGAYLAVNQQLALNSSQTLSPAAQPDVQGRLLRTLLLGLAAEFGDPTVQIQALALFSNQTALQDDIDIRKAVYSIVARSGRQADYEAVKQIYLSASDPNEKSRALGALAYAETSELVAETLEFSLSPAVRSQDTQSLIATVAIRGGASLQAAWDFVRNRYEDISQKLGGTREAGNAMGKLLRSVASGLAEEDAIRQIDEVFQRHKEFLTEPRLQEGAKEDVRANIEWLKRNAKPVCDWLNRL